MFSYRKMAGIRYIQIVNYLIIFAPISLLESFANSISPQTKDDILNTLENAEEENNND